MGARKTRHARAFWPWVWRTSSWRRSFFRRRAVEAPVGSSPDGTKGSLSMRRSESKRSRACLLPASSDSRGNSLNCDRRLRLQEGRRSLTRTACSRLSQSMRSTRSPGMSTSRAACRSHPSWTSPPLSSRPRRLRRPPRLRNWLRAGRCPRSCSSTARIRCSPLLRHGGFARRSKRFHTSSASVVSSTKRACLPT